MLTREHGGATRHTQTHTTEEFGLQTPDYYFYLNQGKTYTVDGMDDNQEFQDTWVLAYLPPNAFT